MRAVLLAVGVMGLSLSASHADTITGAVLADMCVKHEPRASYYILGAGDAFSVRLGAPKRFCFPQGSNIPADHLTNIACKYVVEHAAQRNLEAAVLVFRSLRDAYPCRARK